ncbi:MAG: beta-glucosidase BglX [Bacteroidales bacterium]|nr:beta-glucosidase BglX [Bacteroidales bacterium]
MPLNKRHKILWLSIVILLAAGCQGPGNHNSIDGKVDEILKQMTTQEKIGQLQLLHSAGGDHTELLANTIREGLAGGILNEARPEAIRKLQQVAVEQSRLGIPLLFGRDIIHGFKTIFPINIGLAATFNPDLVRQGAEVAAREAKSVGINWNFAPMVDIARDPRWGRMAESFGEDPLLVTEMGLAMLEGIRSKNTGQNFTMAACAKHFAAYGAAEGGRDYNTTSVPEVELWNTYFKPFMALNEAGISTFMSGFNELNGIPASGNAFLFREILKDRWQFEGFVVSDWASIAEMKTHGFAGNDKEAAAKAMLAGIDMEMAGTSYQNHLAELIESGVIKKEMLDDAVRRILKVKFELGLFEHPYAKADEAILSPPASHLELAKQSAIQSLVLLKNKNNILPLETDISNIAVIGPMAHDRYEQLGTWIFDGDTNLSITPLMALKDMLGDEKVHYKKGLRNTRSTSLEGIPSAIRIAKDADVALVFAGEESIITGEAHSRAYLNLPGAQDDLIRELSETGTPLILLIMTPRPLCIGEIMEHADAVIYAWHPGTMAGPAIAEILFGHTSPSGKLPVTFPKAPGQIPVYYSHKNTGRPPDENSFVAIEDIPERSFQTSLGNTSHYLDIGFKPLFPFGFGLSYTSFSYDNLWLSSHRIQPNDTLMLSIDVANTGNYAADEIVQIYIRDMTASITRPVKELKDFRRITLSPGETRSVQFSLAAADLGFYDKEGTYIVEPGEFTIWAGGNSEAKINKAFTLSEPDNE